MLKKLLKVVLGLAFLLFIAALGIAFFVDTNQWKSALQTAVARNTGYELTIAGDLDLNIFPVLGLTLNDVRVRNPGLPQELASTSAVSLRVDRNELLRGRILIQELLADDLHINYLVNAAGNSAWLIDRTPAAEDPKPTDAGITASEPVAVAFRRISIDNASIDYQNLFRGSRYQLKNIDLESRGANIDGRPFTIDLNFDLARFDAARSRELTTPLALTGNVTADPANDVLRLSDVNFSLTPMLLQGRLTVNDFNSAPEFEGEFRSNRFDSVALLQSLGAMEAETEFTGNIRQSPQISLEFAFSGNDEGVTVPDFRLSLDQEEVEADADIRFATDFVPMNISYEIVGNTLNLSPFLPDDGAESVPQTDTGGGASPSGRGQTRLPFDLLEAVNLRGSVSIESVIANEFAFTDVNLFTNVEDGVLDVELQPAGVFDGTVEGAFRVDGNGADPIVEARLTAQNLNLIDLAPMVSRFNVTTGRLNLESTYTARGATTKNLLDSVSGSSTFSIADNSVNIALIKQVFTAITALSPGGEPIQQWPDVVRFAELGGYALLEGGIQSNQEVKLRMDNVDIGGTGSLDLHAGTFDYDMQFAVLGAPYRQTIPINKRYHGIAWPVDCGAAFSAPPSQYCRPDFQRVRDILAQLATGALRNRLEEEISDPAPQQLRDAARDLLNNLLNN